MSLRPGERFAILVLCLLYFAATGYIGTTRPYWLDETTTIGMASLPQVSDLLAYLGEGREPHPPLPFLLIRLSFALFGPGELPARVPSILAVFGALAAVYQFLRFRLPVPTALAGAALLAVGPAGYYATEARGYGLLLCAAACAALAWQRRRAVGLAASLALAISAHYYAVLLAPVFVVATLVRDRRASLPTLTAIGAGFAPLLAYVPLIRAAMANGLSSWQYNPDNVAQPSFERLLEMGLGAFARLAIPLLLLAGAALYQRRRRNGMGSGLAPAEEVLTVSLVLLPLVLLLISKATVGVFFARYVIVWNVGLAVLAAAALAALWPRPALQWAFVASCLVGPVGWPGLYVPQEGPAAELTGAWRTLSLPADLPLVHADALEFSTVWHYAPGAIRRRLVYLHDVSISRLTRDPVPEHAIQLATTLFPYRTEPYAAFVKSHSAFLMLSTGDRRREWLPQRLRDEGFQLETLRTLSRHTLYRVSPPNSSTD
jgi:4-amino-4-deoxy-L-arabinose transferase-like glycosyltransferase